MDKRMADNSTNAEYQFQENWTCDVIIAPMQEKEIMIKGNKLTIMPLGAGQEVGRSCIILKYNGHRVMFDCGIHPGYENIGGLPFLDAIDPAKIDVLLVSHFHIDHITGVPWFLTQTNFKGPCYMTSTTKSISKTLLVDFVGVSGRGNDEINLFSKVDVQNCQSRITAVNFHQTVTLGSIKMRPYPAGHVLGACMWLVEIDGVKILYTGDFSLEDERHIPGAEIPRTINGEVITPDVLIIESTHGIWRIESREEREYRFISAVKKIVKRGGRCLVPIFALGRAQELLLILEEYWAHSPDLQHIPIYYGSNLMKKSLDAYKAFDQHGAKPLSGKSMFEFQYIKYIRSQDEIEDTLPCVVLCAPAMLQNSMSRIIFERWCSNPVNGLILPGYVVDNTLPYLLLKSPAEIQTMSGQMIPRKISIDYVSFSGHADFSQTKRFIETLRPKRIVLVHGGQQQMMPLKEKIQQMFREEGVDVQTPADCQKAEFWFQSNPTAIVTSGLARERDHISGIIVRHEGMHHIMLPSELAQLTTLKTSRASMRQGVQIKGDLVEYIPRLSKQFEGVCRITNKLVLVGRHLHIVQKDDMCFINYESDPTTDMMADNIAMILALPPPPQNSEEGETEGKVDAFITKLTEALRCRWGTDIEYDADAEFFQFSYRGAGVMVMRDLDSECGVEVEVEPGEEEGAAKIDPAALSAEIKRIAKIVLELTSPLRLHHGSA